MAAPLDIEVHHLCSIFPDMSPVEYTDLVSSIRENGLLDPVVLWEGKILDGRHRFRACVELGIEPRIKEYRGQAGSPEAYVVSRNLHRRNLSPSQRATIGVDIKRSLEAKYKVQQVAHLKRGESKPSPRFGINTETGNDSRKEAAESVGVSEKYISDAERIQDASPQVFAEVKSGEKTIPQAKRDLGIGKPKPAKPKSAESPPTDGDSLTSDIKPNAIVNGVPAYDEGVARAVAAGRIPAGVAVVVDDPGEDATDIDDVAIEREEQAAKVDDLSDDEWLARLPLSSILGGVSLSRFRRDALHYRRLESKRRGIVQANGSVVKEVYRGTPWRGAVQAALSWWLRMEHPERWKKCPPTDKGGCDGVGMTPILGGDCQTCKGRGYLAR